MATGNSAEESSGARNKIRADNASADGQLHTERLASNRSREIPRKLSFQGRRFNSSDDVQRLADIPEGAEGDGFGQGEPCELVEAIHPSIAVHRNADESPNELAEVKEVTANERQAFSLYY